MAVLKRTRKSGVRWVAVVDVGADPATGKRKQMSETFRTKDAAEKWERKTRSEVDAGTFVKPSNDSFASHLAHWLETIDAAPNTLRSYRGVVRRLIVPRLGAVPLGKLTGRDIQDTYNVARDTSYAEQVQAVISGSLRLAVREGLIARNPAEGLTVGRSERAEPTTPPVWTPNEVRTFLAGVRDHWLSPLFWTAAYTGLRLSELVALRWDDISLDLGLLFVGKGKSAASRRRLALDVGTVDVLRVHQTEQAARRDALGPEWHDGGFVFDRGNGQPVAPRTVEATMTRYVARLGLPHLTPHGLRHTHATALLQAGVPVHHVQRRLGHESARTTLDNYAHALPGSERDVAERFAALVAGTARELSVNRTSEAGEFSAS